MRNLSPLRLAAFSLVAWLAACGDDGDGVTDPSPAAGAGQGGQTAGSGGSGGKTAGSGGSAGASQGGAGAGGAGGAGKGGAGGAGGAGKGGTAGNAGNAGNAGTAGTAGTAGKGGAGGAGNGGTAGSGATAGSAGKGGTAGAGNGGAAGSAGNAGSAGSGGDPCPAGQVDCPCGPGDVCDSGSCVGGVCVVCPTGELGCDCFSDGSCGKDLRCESSLCVACIAGLQGCPCGEGDICGTGLKCQGDLCVPSDCTDGVQGCPCLPDKTCEGGLVCGDSLCRAAIDCATLVSAGSCDPNQTCTEAAAGSDAVCVPETCNAGFLWNPLTSKCVACVTPDCSAEPSCDASAPGSIATKCADQQRECVQAGAVAFCGPCVAGTSENAGQCVALPSCGGVTCALNEYCDKQASTPTCTPLPCPAGQSKDTSGACISCSSSCEGEGLTGRPWPFTSLSDECICETKDNYFLLSGGASVATACDADGDGWVRKESEESTDPQIIQNNRCKLRTIDRVILVDQYGVSMEVGSCAQGLIKLPDNTSCPTRVPLRLLETLLLDEPGLIDQDPSTPPYANGGKTKDTGRPLQARELNTLTKACVSLNGDYNNNQIADIAEVQPLTPGEDDQLRLSAFAYFVELYSAVYEPPSSGEGPGRMVLRERSRCGDDFPLRYDTSVTDPTVLPPADAWVDNGSGSTYWRNCYVGRDPAYNSKSAAPGFDFAQWSCDATSGSCSLPPQPAHADLVNVDPKQTLMRDHGLCELQGKLPKDNLWRGMSHHSQFKCVNVTSQPPSKPYDRALADFSDPAPNLFVLDSCAARACAETPCAGSREISPGSNAFEPVIDCTALPTATAGVVGFAAVRYQGYGALTNGYNTTSYQGGCVNEDTAWGSLICPSPQFTTTKSEADSSFGRYSCYGDPQNYLWCSQPCTPQISTLHWAAKGSPSSVNGSLWR